MAEGPSFDDLLSEVAAFHYSMVARTQDLQVENGELRVRLSKLEGPSQGDVSPTSSPSLHPSSHGVTVLPATEVEHPALDVFSEEDVMQPHASYPLQLQAKFSREQIHPDASLLHEARTPKTEERASIPQGQRTEGINHNDELKVFAGSEQDVRAYPLWPTWVKSQTRPVESGAFTQMSQSSLTSSFIHPAKPIRGGDVLRDEKSWLQCLVLGPNCRKRVCWDILSLLSVAHDVLTVPLLAFDMMETPFVQVSSVVTTLFWSLDMPISFLSGYYVGGAIEMRPRMIARHYMRRWFAIDILILISDWSLFFLHSGLADVVGIARVTKTLRLSRILRLIRLMRVMKVPDLLEDVIGSFASDGLITTIGVLRSIMLIVIVNHFIACGWYAVSFLGPTELRWVAQLEAEGRGVGYRYCTALHWSLTQFTPASMEVSPRNIYERVFAICVLISAMVTFSTFISSITTMMTTLRRIGAEKSKQRENIRKYVLENHLSIELGNQITNFLRDQTGMGKKRVHEADIQALKLLPEALKVHLHWEVYSWRLSPHPFFFHLLDSDQETFAQICHHAMTEVSLRTSEELFSCGQRATRVHFLLSGFMEYNLYSDNPVVVQLSKGQCITEVVLWVQWMHQGRLYAKTLCEFVTLDSCLFRKVVSQRPQIRSCCMDYAWKFQAQLLRLPLDHPTEIWCDFDLTQELAQTSFDKVLEGGSRISSRGLANLWRSWSPVGRIRNWSFTNASRDNRSPSVSERSDMY